MITHGTAPRCREAVPNPVIGPTRAVPTPPALRYLWRVARAGAALSSAREKGVSAHSGGSRPPPAFHRSRSAERSAPSTTRSNSVADTPTEVSSGPVAGAPARVAGMRSPATGQDCAADSCTPTPATAAASAGARARARVPDRGMARKGPSRRRLSGAMPRSACRRSASRRLQWS